MSNTYEGRSTIPSSGYGPNQTVYYPQSQATGYSGNSADYSYGPSASYMYYVRPRVKNPETRCSRLGRTVLLCSTFVSAACAIVMFYLSAATSNLDYLIILSLCLLLIQAATGIFVSFTKNKWILFLFSFYCLFNGLAVGTLLAVKGPYPMRPPQPPPFPPTRPPINDPTATTPLDTPAPTSPGSPTTTKVPNDETTSPLTSKPPTRPPDIQTTTSKVTNTTSTRRVRMITNDEDEERTNDYYFESRQSRQRTSPVTTTTKITTTKTTKSPANLTTTTSQSPTTSATTVTTATTTKMTVAPPLEPEKRMAFVYVFLWFSVANDLVMSFVAFTLICSIGADPDRQLFSESEIAGSSSSTSSGGAQRSRSPSVRHLHQPPPMRPALGSVAGAVGSQQQPSLSRTGRSGMRSNSPSGRWPPQTGSQVTAATQSVSGRSGASGSRATMMQNRSFLSGASQASSRASRATGASLLSARGKRPPPSNAYG